VGRMPCSEIARISPQRVCTVGVHRRIPGPEGCVNLVPEWMVARWS
jgi:hypothetical protein